MQRNHCAPAGRLSKDLSLLYVMFTLTTDAAPKCTHMAYTHGAVVYIPFGDGCGGKFHVPFQLKRKIWGKYPLTPWICTFSGELNHHASNVFRCGQKKKKKISGISKKHSASGAGRSRGNVSDVSPRLPPTGPRLCVVAKLSSFISLRCQQQNERLEKTPDNLYT